jgi:hypothetical protein
MEHCVIHRKRTKLLRSTTSKRPHQYGKILMDSPPWAMDWMKVLKAIQVHGYKQYDQKARSLVGYHTSGFGHYLYGFILLFNIHGIERIHESSYSWVIILFFYYFILTKPF